MTIQSITNKSTAATTKGGFPVRERIRERPAEQGEFLIFTTPRVYATACSMTRLKRLFLSLTLLALFDLNAFAQSPVIATYAGSQWRGLVTRSRWYRRAIRAAYSSMKTNLWSFQCLEPSAVHSDSAKECEHRRVASRFAVPISESRFHQQRHSQHVDADEASILKRWSPD